MTSATIYSVDEALRRVRDQEVETLDLSGQKILDIRTVALLADALCANRTLTELDLTRNSLGMSGAVSLARALEVNETLKTLVLKDCFIDDVGAINLARALKANGTLRVLDLRDNRIKNAGAIAFAKALEKNTGLTELVLMGNHGIDHTGKKFLMEVFLNSPNLIYLTFSTPPTHSDFEHVSEQKRDFILSLIDKAAAPGTLTEKDIRHIEERVPAIIRVAEVERGMDAGTVGALLAGVKDAAEKKGIVCVMPTRLDATVQDVPEIFRPQKWIGNTQAMQRNWEDLPSPLRRDFDFAAVLAEAQKETLKRRAAKAKKLRGLLT